MAKHTTSDVRHGHPNTGRPTRFACQSADPTLSLDEHVVGFHVPIQSCRFRMAVARNINCDQGRVLFTQGCGSKTCPVCSTWSHILHPNVGLAQDSVKEGLVVRALKVQRKRFLATINVDEIGRLSIGELVVSSSKVPLAVITFNLDDASASICKPGGAERCCNGLLKGDDQDALKRSTLRRRSRKTSPKRPHSCIERRARTGSGYTSCDTAQVSLVWPDI
mmetsp:Transcript_30093/g.65029  ORF Transcript_30093/g.65029 Transcript_30093/m.65029 type:complete len:221 (-) Transcript_30093:120-782(-)